MPQLQKMCFSFFIVLCLFTSTHCPLQQFCNDFGQDILATHKTLRQNSRRKVSTFPLFSQALVLKYNLYFLLHKFGDEAVLEENCSLLGNFLFISEAAKYIYSYIAGKNVQHWSSRMGLSVEYVMHLSEW